MPTGSERLVPPLTSEERARFEADGAVVLRRLRTMEDGELMAEALGIVA